MSPMFENLIDGYLEGSAAMTKGGKEIWDPFSNTYGIIFRNG